MRGNVFGPWWGIYLGYMKGRIGGVKVKIRRFFGETGKISILTTFLAPEQIFGSFILFYDQKNIYTRKSLVWVEQVAKLQNWKGSGSEWVFGGIPDIRSGILHTRLYRLPREIWVPYFFWHTRRPTWTYKPNMGSCARWVPNNIWVSIYRSWNLKWASEARGPKINTNSPIR